MFDFWVWRFFYPQGALNSQNLSCLSLSFKVKGVDLYWNSVCACCRWFVVGCLRALALLRIHPPRGDHQCPCDAFDSSLATSTINLLLSACCPAHPKPCSSYKASGIKFADPPPGVAHPSLPLFKLGCSCNVVSPWFFQFLCNLPRSIVRFYLHGLWGNLQL